MWGGWSTPRPGRFTARKDTVPIVQEAGWAPGPIWTGAENLAPTGIRSPNFPARSESLYRLSYPGYVDSKGKDSKIDDAMSKQTKFSGFFLKKLNCESENESNLSYKIYMSYLWTGK